PRKRRKSLRFKVQTTSTQSDRDGGSTSCNCTGNSLDYDQRKNILFQNKRCFRCTVFCKTAVYCRSRRTVLCTKCSKHHVTVMCNPQWANIQQTEGLQENNVSETSQSSASSVSNNTSKHI